MRGLAHTHISGVALPREQVNHLGDIHDIWWKLWKFNIVFCVFFIFRLSVCSECCMDFGFFAIPFSAPRLRTHLLWATAACTWRAVLEHLTADETWRFVWFCWPTLQLFKALMTVIPQPLAEAETQMELAILHDSFYGFHLYIDFKFNLAPVLLLCNCGGWHQPRERWALPDSAQWSPTFHFFFCCDLVTFWWANTSKLCPRYEIKILMPAPYVIVVVRRNSHERFEIRSRKKQFCIWIVRIVISSGLRPWHLFCPITPTSRCKPLRKCFNILTLKTFLFTQHF